VKGGGHQSAHNDKFWISVAPHSALLCLATALRRMCIVIFVIFLQIWYSHNVRTNINTDKVKCFSSHKLIGTNCCIINTLFQLLVTKTVFLLTTHMVRYISLHTVILFVRKQLLLQLKQCSLVMFYKPFPSQATIFTLSARMVS